MVQGPVLGMVERIQVRVLALAETSIPPGAEALIKKQTITMRRPAKSGRGDHRVQYDPLVFWKRSPRSG